MPRLKKEKRELTPEEKLEKKRLKLERERARSQSALETILTELSDIPREEVGRAAIEQWRAELNATRCRGETIKLKDFLVCTEAADPFNADAPANRELAEWFVKQWRKFKPYDYKVHVRGLHYSLVTVADTPDAVHLPNGLLYENTDLRWKDLECAGKYARYLGLIEPNRFEDRRSRRPEVAYFWEGEKKLEIEGKDPDISYQCRLRDLPDFPDFPKLDDFPDFPVYDLTLREQQRYRLELWIEKSTQDNVVLPICRMHTVTAVIAQGEISISAMWDAIMRAEKYPETVSFVRITGRFLP